MIRPSGLTHPNGPANVRHNTLNERTNDMPIAIATAFAALLLVLGAGLLASAASSDPQAVSVEEVSAAATAMQDLAMSYASPEEAALSAAAQFYGSDGELHVSVVLRFPEPDDHNVRVAVTRTADDSCRVWGAHSLTRTGLAVMAGPQAVMAMPTFADHVRWWSTRRPFQVPDAPSARNV